LSILEFYESYFEFVDDINTVLESLLRTWKIKKKIA
jgi:hypothetical protein